MTLTTPGGLTSVDAAQRRARHGPNTIVAGTRSGVPAKAGRQLRDPMIMLLLGAAVLTMAQGDMADTAVIVTVVLLNSAVGVVQEVKAERAVTALQSMAAPLAGVRRDGERQVVPAADIVPGDLLLLESGDVVAADASVVEEHLLQTDDSALTGESLPVDKPVGSEVHAGTTVTRGRGAATVTGTGGDSSLGRIATMVAAARPGPTPLQRRLTRLGRQLTVAAVTVSGLVFGLSLLRGMELRDAALTAVSLAVAAVPESLPAVLTLSLALGAHRMARHHAIARELRAVETLGSVTLLATDKTGTLTENRMVVERCWTPVAEYTVTGEGYSPDGALHRTGSTVRPSRNGTIGDGDDRYLARLLRDVALCNDADVVAGPDGRWTPVGDPTEAALVALARRGGVDVTGVRSGHVRTGEVPFDSSRAWMATEHVAACGRLVVCKGAPEAVLAEVAAATVCAAEVGAADVGAAEVGAADVGTAETMAGALAWADARATEGFRVLVVADGPAHDADLQQLTHVPSDLDLVGLVAMTDPPRADVPAVLRSLDEAGIRVVVMTGDHPATAAAVARRVGLLADDTQAVPTGADLDAAARGELPATSVGRAPVYARVRPEHKLALVESWQRAGDVVAVTGDGVNDGPALRTAAIGVAMGGGGTEVARQAADLVLTDDRLRTVVHAVEEGRRIQDNLRRFLRYALSGGVAEVLYMLVAPVFGLLVPLLPAQILWINMLTHGLPGVAMGAEPASAGSMQRRPVAVDVPVIDRVLARRIARAGALIAAVTLTAALVTRGLDAHARTSAFLVLGLAQLGVALALRERGAARGNRFLTGAVVVAVLLQLAAVLAPPLQALLGTQSLPLQVWVWNALLAAVPAAALRIAQLRAR